MTVRARAWVQQWGPILPLLVAEGTVWLGFGALLPILSIYFTHHGVDLPTLGVVVAAWPAARLVGEPVFGWVADRSSRKRMMVIGLAFAAVVAVMPLFAVGPLAFIVLRALAGLAAAVYDPAARGYITDANVPERQGETFGLYGSAQMGGFMLGPAVGGLAVAATGEPTVVFWVAGIAQAISALMVVLLVSANPRMVGAPAGSSASAASAPTPASTAPDPAALDDDAPRPRTLLNGLLAAALVFNIGSFLAGGTYEVVWSLYLSSLGASIGLIGVTFFSFSLPVMLLSPFTGRLVDKEGGFFALVLGLAGVGACSIVYTLVPSVWFVVGVGIIEGSAFAFASPALYMLVARASPPGRSSTAQGIFGAAGTLGTITASLFAGVLAQVDLRLPFLVNGIAVFATLALGLVLGRRMLWRAMQPSHLHAAAPGVLARAEEVP